MAGAIALVAVLALAADITKKQNAAGSDAAVRTSVAAKATGADVTPSTTGPVNTPLEVPARQ